MKSLRPIPKYINRIINRLLYVEIIELNKSNLIYNIALILYLNILSFFL
jgi:hypothetical protein